MMRMMMLLVILTTACGKDRIHLGGSSPATDAGTQAPSVDAREALDAAAVPKDGSAASNAGRPDDSGQLDDGGRRNGRGDGGRGDGQHR